VAEIDRQFAILQKFRRCGRSSNMPTGHGQQTPTKSILSSTRDILQCDRNIEHLLPSGHGAGQIPRNWSFRCSQALGLAI
jgi:hypothetical protein